MNIYGKLRYKLTFIRMRNQYNTRQQKDIGFSIIGKKRDMYKLMLQCITDFTIAGSYTHVFYKKLSSSTFLNRSFYRKIHKEAKANQFFINGECYFNKNTGKQYNSIFQFATKKGFA